MVTIQIEISQIPYDYYKFIISLTKLLEDRKSKQPKKKQNVEIKSVV